MTVPSISLGPERSQRSIIASDEQLTAERLLINILRDPRIDAVKRRVRHDLAVDLASGAGDDGPDAEAWLDRALDLWIASLVMREIGADASRPQVIQDFESASREYFGLSVPPHASAGENPDNVYRFTALDGRYRYVLSGQVSARRPPANFSVAVRMGSVRRPPGSPGGAGRAESGVHVGVLTERDLHLDAAGRFALTLDSTAGAPGSCHLQIPEGPLTAELRNIFSDWDQEPTSFVVSRTDSGTCPPPLTQDEIVVNTVDDFSEWAWFWYRLPRTFLGNPPLNSVPTPVSREGGWGRLTACHFELNEGEALVVRTRTAGAGYVGAQIVGPWLVAPDPVGRIVSRNGSQSHVGDDGGITYVVTSSDPGYANWIDNLGLRRGRLVLRWSAFPSGVEPDAADLVRGVEIVQRSDLQSVVGSDLPQVSADARRQELERRRQGYRNRLRAGSKAAAYPGGRQR